MLCQEEMEQALWGKAQEWAGVWVGAEEAAQALREIVFVQVAGLRLRIRQAYRVYR